MRIPITMDRIVSNSLTISLKNFLKHKSIISQISNGKMSFPKAKQAVFFLMLFILILMHVLKYYHK